ncbi:putative fatty acyl-CoA reductase CG5065 [Toxorhynchites rutilus septentrionalis]|uniref:putative fatty acyl-CoA reductase CG5065 n=1 Tax=Toxorhynchites rutilus septentrionalis TaxID=329112 RepID=UPI0024789519|nr:putative fatty acyl-CoA reductase CG5065 [Toxorhynchites rutilus septentrionalis]
MASSMEQNNRITEFYNNSVVLLCGATGFMGKVLLEKILRNVNVRTIYVLIRRKHNLDGQQRLKELLSETLFENIDQEKLTNCVKPLDVDFDQDDLSINENIRSVLVDEVEIVFNLIASIKFNEPLESALKINVEYTQRVLRMVTSFRRLRSIIHVSTFYSNCDRSFIEEKVFEDIPFGGYDNIRRIMAPLSPSEKQILTPHILGKLPNSYTFSKKCTELMIRDHFGNLPIGIFRPPIVGPVYRDPIPGWLDNFNGPSGVLFAIHEGMLRVIPLDKKKKPFLAPVDFCVNGMLCCAVDIASLLAEKIPVYNFTDEFQLYNWGEIFCGFMNGMSPLRRFFKYAEVSL